MGNGFRLLLAVVLSALAAGAAEAAPTPGAALERYEEALVRGRLDLASQGVYFETLSGKTLLAHNAEGRFNPASVVKLATSDTALRRLGPDYRFLTRAFAAGPVDAKTGELRGDLVLVGSGDPSLMTEHAFGLAEALRAAGVRRVTGDLVVKGPLALNFSNDPASAGRVLKAAMDPAAWGPLSKQAWRRARPGADAAAFEGVAVEGDVVTRSDVSVEGLAPLVTHRSAPLAAVLKLLNDHSNNWMAHMIGATLGGAGSVERSVEDAYGVDRGDMWLETTSGLGDNAMRPRDVVKLLRGLDRTLGAAGLSPSAVMPVAGVDEGTLDDRLGGPGVRGSVVAKTGTLDSVSALAGFMYTRSEGVVLFAIMNRRGSPSAFRPLQDLLVREVLDACGGGAPPAYARKGWGDALGGSEVTTADGTVAAAPAGRPRAAAPARHARAAGAPPVRWGVAPVVSRLRASWSPWVTADSLFDVRPPA